MDWTSAVIDDLRNYVRRKDSLNNIRDRIESLRAFYESRGCGMNSDTRPLSGDTSKLEERMLSNIVERKKLVQMYKATKKLVEVTKRGLDTLDERERKVLDGFYIAPVRDHITWLMNELGVNRSEVYRIKDNALYKFVINQYGIIDY